MALTPPERFHQLCKQQGLPCDISGTEECDFCGRFLECAELYLCMGGEIVCGDCFQVCKKCGEGNCPDCMAVCSRCQTEGCLHCLHFDQRGVLRCEACTPHMTE